MSNEARFSPYQPPDARSIGRPQHSGAGSTDERVRGSRRMGEMRALIEAASGSVETDEQVGAWSLTAHLDPPGSAPFSEETP